MPMVLAKTSCTLVLLDEKVGEMVYKIELETLLPESLPLNPIKVTLDVDKDFGMQIPVVNERLQAALNHHNDRLRKARLVQEQQKFIRWRE